MKEATEVARAIRGPKTGKPLPADRKAGGNVMAVAKGLSTAGQGELAVTYQVKSIAAFQTSLVFGLVNFIFGVVSAIAMAISPMTPMMGGHPGMLLWLPFGYGIGAFVVSAIFCVAYNVVAKLVGGIEIELSGEKGSYPGEMEHSSASVCD